MKYLSLFGLGLLAFASAGASVLQAQGEKPKLGYVSVTFGFNSTATGKDGKFVYVEGAKRVQKLSGGLAEIVQIPLFPGNLTAKGLPQTQKLWRELREVVPTVVPILMLDQDPRNDANMEEVAETLATGLIECGKLGAVSCSSTSFEAWMADTLNKKPALKGEELDKAIAQLVRVHVKAIRKAQAAGSKVTTLDMEYLRPVEFSTFTNISVAYRVVGSINKELGKPFVRILDDLAHAGDSGLALKEINAVRVRAKTDGAYGIVHFSKPTTRGKLGEAELELLEQARKNGMAKAVLVEIFDPLGPETQLMRDNIPGYRAKKSFDDPAEAIADGLKLAKKFFAGK